MITSTIQELKEKYDFKELVFERVKGSDEVIAVTDNNITFKASQGIILEAECIVITLNCLSPELSYIINSPPLLQI